MSAGKKEARQLPPAGLSGKNTKHRDSAQPCGRRQTPRRERCIAWLLLLAMAAAYGGLA